MAKKPASTIKSYQELSQELDELVMKLQDPEVAIDDATQHYEDAMKLIVQLEMRLEKAENQVSQIRTKYTENS